MRAATAVNMVVAVVIALCALFTASRVFTVAQSDGAALNSAGLSVPPLTVAQAEGAAMGPRLNIGLWCISGVAAAAAVTASAKSRCSAKARTSVVLRAGKEPTIISKRLEDAVKLSADFEERMSQLRERNERMMLEVQLKRAKAKAVARERDELKAQLISMVEKIDSSLIGPLKQSCKIASGMTTLQDRHLTPSPATSFAELLGPTMLTKDGEMPTEIALAGKKSVVLYFSANWCGPCRAFTPTLAEAYSGWKASGGTDGEVILVSLCRDQVAFDDYFGKMPWMAVPFGTGVEKGLRERFGVKTIPGLVVLGQDASELYTRKTMDARQMVVEYGAEAFPLDLETLSGLEAKAAAERAAAVKKVSEHFAGHFAECPRLALLFSDGDFRDGTYQTVSKIIASCNEAGHRMRLVYVDWSDHNGQCNHDQTAAMFDNADRFEVTDEWREVLSKLPAKHVGTPHLMVLSSVSGEVHLEADLSGCTALKEFGLEGFPWSEERLEELQTERRATIELLRASQANFQLLKEEGRDTLIKNDGTEVKVDTLAGRGPAAVTGFYFSAHWCRPCRSFTPVLAKCYEELRSAGKQFEVVWMSSDKDVSGFNEYFREMPWLALPHSSRKLKDALSGLFEVTEIPTLVLLNADGSTKLVNGREAIDVGPAYFPWEPKDLELGRSHKAAAALAAAIETEERVSAAQMALGGPVLKRVRGRPGACSFNAITHQVTFREFGTVAAPEFLATTGVLYYELIVDDMQGCPQFGFALAAFKHDSVQGVEGVGDDDLSWGLDGLRMRKWHASELAWDCRWARGDVLSFAANIDAGKIAFAKNGSWSNPGCGVVFQDQKIKAGVYPCLAAQAYKVTYNLDGSAHGAFRFGPPPAGVWV